MRSLELRPLGLSRAAFGLVFLLRTTPILAAFHPAFLRGGPGWLGWPAGGWHVGITLAPALAKLLVVARTLAAVALMLGVRTRIAGLVAGVAGYVLLAQDAFGYFHHLHLLYLGAILFALVDADASFALRPAPAHSPASSLLLMRAFTASIYLWAAIGKLASEWGTGRALALFRLSGALHIPAPLARPVVEIAVVATEVALGVLLLVPRTRRVALVAALLLHLTFEIVGRVDSIGWQMVALLLVFTGSGPPRTATRSPTARTSHPTAAAPEAPPYPSG